ncbi:MAG: hypothetical protein ACYC1C_22125 [Chloroflexota bacterium]
MEKNRQEKSWLIDAALFVGMLYSMLFDVTGLDLHQWLGLAVVLLAGYHLLLHWRWVVAITKRLFGGLHGRTRDLYATNAILLLGFLVTGLTGLVISTWLQLPLGDYLLWRDVHVIASILTLSLVLMKVALHWRWIITAAAQVFVVPPADATGTGRRVPVRVKVGRRDFLGLMGLVGATALATAVNPVLGVLASATSPAEAEAAPVGDALAASIPVAPAPANGQSGQPAAAEASAAPTSVPGSTPTPSTSATVVPAAQEALPASNACVPCPFHRHCSYPGKCFRYTDSNGNRRCDLGECVA